MSDFSILKQCLLTSDAPESVWEPALSSLIAERDALKAKLAAAEHKYSELCKDIAEWHPMDDCAQELHYLKAQVAKLAEALEEADEVLATIHVTEALTNENEPTEWTLKVEKMTCEAIDKIRAALAAHRENR